MFYPISSCLFLSYKICLKHLFCLDLSQNIVLHCSFAYHVDLSATCPPHEKWEVITGEREGNGMSFGPAFVLDKSTLQGLSPECVVMLTRYYRHPVPPILLRELTSDLEDSFTVNMWKNFMRPREEQAGKRSRPSPEAEAEIKAQLKEIQEAVAKQQAMERMYGTRENSTIFL